MNQDRPRDLRGGRRNIVLTSGITVKHEAHQSWLRNNFYKLIFGAVLVLIALQYAFSLIYESHQIEPFFSINGTHSKRLASEIRLPYSLTTRRNTSILPKYLIHNNGTIQDLFNQNLTYNQLGYSNSTVINGNTSSTIGKPLCPPIPPNLVGPLKVIKDTPSIEEMEKEFPMLEPGGHYKPNECQARDRVAIIVPYRDRLRHLTTFLYNIHPMLQRQQLDYGIFIIEQDGNGPFNRAMLMNIGFVEALKLYNYDCFVFHDIDLIPEDDRNLYTCPEQPRHMSVAIDTFNYKLPYDTLFGGVSALTKLQFYKLNGFSNVFWGWGGEDDDMANRILYHGFHVSRYPAPIARYKMLSHRKQVANPKRFEYLYSGRKRFKTDGLNSLHYHRKDLKLYKLYAKVLVELTSPS